MRASLGGLLVVLGWLTFARAVHNVTVDYSETSRLTYFPAPKWVEVESGAEDSTISQYNGTAAMASTIGAQVSFTFNGTAIYWRGYGTSNSSQFVEIIVDDVKVMVDVSFAGLDTNYQGVAFFRPNLRVDQLHNITVRVIKNDNWPAVLYHVAFIYTVPDEGGTQSPIGAYSILEVPRTTTTASNTVTFTSQPIATPTTSAAGQTPNPDNRNQKAGTIVVGALIGLGVVVGGMVLYFCRRRSKIDAERSSKPYLSLDGGDGPPRSGMLEASITRARYGGVKSPLGGQTQAIPPLSGLG